MSGWATAESPLHAFSLPLSGEDAQSRRRPGDFDHRQAWQSHREGLYELVSEMCLALQTCEPDAVVRSQQLALRRLARALAAIWTIDERVRVPSTRASDRCR